MRRLGIIWLLHWLATVAGWYALSALAQGIADSAATVSVPFVMLDGALRVLCFPVVLGAVNAVSSLGSFTYASFLLFALVAAVNSALVTAVVGALLRAFSPKADTDT